MPPKPKYDYKVFRELYKQGLGDHAIAREVGCRPTTVGYWRRKNELPPNIPPKPKKFELLKNKFAELYLKGKTWKEIAETLHISNDSIKSWRKRLKLKRQKTWNWGKWQTRNRLQRQKRAYYLFKVKKFSFEEIATEMEVSVERARILIGQQIMQECRKEPKCPYKPLLPENFV